MRLNIHIKSLLRYSGSTHAAWAIFFIIYLTSSHAICCNVYGAIVSYVVFLLAFISIITSTSKINTNCILWGVLFVLLMGCTTIINGEDLKPYILVSASLMLGALYAATFSLAIFREAYIYVILVLCVISLFFYPLYLLIPQLSGFNVLQGDTGVAASSLLVFTSHNPSRNQSIFWEPGAFQTFICLATFLELTKSQFSKERIWIFVISCLTTLSTTGYFCMMLLLPWYMVKSHMSFKKYIKVIIIAIILGALAFILFYDILFSTSSSSVFGKLLVLYANGGFSEDNVTSASVRYFSIIKPIGVFLNNPFFGVGYQGLKDLLYDYTRNMNTCTFINYFAVYGIFFGFVAIRGYWRFIKIFEKKSKSIFWLFLFLFFITFSEDYVNFCFFYILIIYGLTYPDKFLKRCYKNIHTA